MRSTKRFWISWIGQFGGGGFDGRDARISGGSSVGIPDILLIEFGAQFRRMSQGVGLDGADVPAGNATALELPGSRRWAEAFYVRVDKLLRMVPLFGAL
jgi:hypothetical protein